MNWPAICAAAIPCLNESATIGRIVRDVRTHLATVIVVDDGSHDRTGDEARAAGAEVIRHSKPRGKGASLRHAWEVARQRGFEWTLCMDGDGQHLASDIPRFLECVERTGAAMVVGNRMPQAERMPRVRRHVNRWMSRRLSRLSGHTLPDTQNGFRLINLRFWNPQTTAATHFEIESEMLIAYLVQELRVEFVPVAVVYRSERSKIHPWRDTVRWLRWWRETVRGLPPRTRR